MADLISMLAACAGGGEKDPNFNQTVLLLHGDGTNGAQNNTFLDSSTNNFTITRNGNTTQGTFSPFSLAAGEWSNYFDGSGDYLSLTGTSLGSGNFTLEFWVYLPTSGVGIFFDSRTSDVSSTGFAFYRNSSNYLSIFTDGTGTAGTNVIPTNQWVHLALVRNSNTIYGYMNGVQQFTRANSATMSLTSWKIFAQYDNTNLATGYLSNFRITTTAVYTAAFTPPTAPLTAITNTSLLTCQSNRFVDNSTNAFAITRNGDVRVTPFSPFAPSAAYSAGTNGGSGYFDGSGDYLSVADNAALDIGTGDFQISFWVYPTAFAGSIDANTIFYKGANNIVIAFNNSGTISVAQYGVAVRVSSSVNITLNQWAYIVVSRVSSTTKIFLNGTEVGSASDTSNYDSATAASIGLDTNVTTQRLTGYLADFRLVKGSGVTSVTVPTAPLTAITNTSLLCNFTNAGIFDNTGKNNLETVADAQIDTTTKKYGTGSMEFDGTGDYLVTPNNTEFILGSGDFTLEAWINTNASATVQSICAKETSGTDAYLFFIANSSGNKIALNLSSTGSGYSLQLVGTTTLATGTWYHVAAVRSGSGTNNIKLYVNGTQEAQGTFSGTIYNDTSLFTVGYRKSTSNLFFNGYIDDLRITKGVARYTAAFTPPTAAFPNE